MADDKYSAMSDAEFDAMLAEYDEDEKPWVPFYRTKLFIFICVGLAIAFLISATPDRWFS